MKPGASVLALAAVFTGCHHSPPARTGAGPSATSTWSSRRRSLSRRYRSAWTGWWRPRPPPSSSIGATSPPPRTCGWPSSS